MRLEVAADTAAALVDGSVADDVDAWITTSAWVEVVDRRAADALGDGDSAGHLPAVVAVAPGRFEAVEALCAGERRVGLPRRHGRHRLGATSATGATPSGGS